MLISATNKPVSDSVLIVDVSDVTDGGRSSLTSSGSDGSTMFDDDDAKQTIINLDTICFI